MGMFDRNAVNAERQWRLAAGGGGAKSVHPDRNAVNAERQWRRLIGTRLTIFPLATGTR